MLGEWKKTGQSRTHERLETHSR